MYSLLLMSAMAGTPDAAAFGGRRDAGCHGCTGAVAASCYGGCYGSDAGAACYGSCYGSSCYGSACYGSSGCQGDGGGLLRGGLFGLRGGRKAASCHGSTACYGSCHGGSCHGASCYGSCHGAGAGAGCHGAACYGSGCHGAGCSGCGGVIVSTDLPSIPVVEGRTVAAAVAEIPAVTAAATITVELPASAKLYVDGVPTAATGTTRQFHTPELAAGKAFYYEMKAEVVVNGRVEVEQKRVVVRAGATLTESFPKLLAAAKADTAVATAAAE